MKEIKEGVYLIPDNLRAIIKDSGKTLIIQKRKRINPHLKEEDYRCKNCIHRVKGYCYKNIRWYESFVCEMKPKGEGDFGQKYFYSCSDTGKPCEHFSLKP